MSKALYLGDQNAPFPVWSIFHIPHDSLFIPFGLREEFVLDDEDLKSELFRITDLYTHAIYAEEVEASNIICAPVSRLVVDVERFAFDEEESMAKVGQGVIYKQSSLDKLLRRPLSWVERQYILEHYYYPHHALLTKATQNAICRYGRALILDCHSFAATPMPLEPDQNQDRPDICIGTDSFHTPETLIQSLMKSFKNMGFSVSLNTPFSGSLVPMAFYGVDRRVQSVMIEINRQLYLDEKGEKKKNFDTFSSVIRQALSQAITFLY